MQEGEKEGGRGTKDGTPGKMEECKTRDGGRGGRINLKGLRAR